MLKRGLCRSLDSLCICWLCVSSTESCALWLPWSHQTVNLFSSTQGSFRFCLFFFVPVTQLRNSPTTELPCFQNIACCFENHFLYSLSLWIFNGCFRQKGKSWPCYSTLAEISLVIPILKKNISGNRVGENTFQLVLWGYHYPDIKTRWR